MRGDFNVINCRNACSRNGRNLADHVFFTNWLNQLRLIDLDFFPSPFTWARGVKNCTRIQRCLDRAVCNIEWRVEWQEVYAKHLDCVFSDHAPLLLQFDLTQRMDQSKRPFRFLSSWLSYL